MKVDQNLECFDYEEMVKVRFVTLEFGGYALEWWNHIAYDIRSMRRASVESWSELKRKLRKRSKSVEEYFKEIEVSIIRAQFLHHYTSPANLDHQAIEVELQLKRHGISRKSYPSSSWKSKKRKEEIPRKDKSLKKGSILSSGQKEELRSLLKILGKLCSFIINGGYSVNVASLRVVEKIIISILPHPMPYKLQ
ncbi:hypothetical protein CR513_41831, partial [Mucuna pruriens]